MVFALAFALFLLGLVCLVGDASFAFRWSTRAESAAQLAAQSGADAVDPRYLYAASACGGGRCAAIVDVDPADRTGDLYAFERACLQSGDQSAQVPVDPPRDLAPKSADDPQTPEGTRCGSDGCRVWAEVTRIVPLPIPLPGFPATVTVRGEAFAAPVVGAATPVTECRGGAWVPAPPPPS